MKARKTAVIGDGGWGTALALHLSKNGHRVTLWGAFPEYVRHVAKKRENTKFLPGYKIPKKIKLTSDLEEAIAENDILVLAIPTPFIRSVLSKTKTSWFRGKIVVNVSKGMETETLQLSSHIIQEFVKGAPVAVLSGPSHAEEVARGAPTCVTVASRSKQAAKELQQLFSSKLFRVYTSNDVLGVQLGAALKNVMAIAGGICDGLNYGDNTKSALLARGVNEMMRLGVKMGAKRETFAGLSGLGDLATTCFSPHGRNRAVGEQIGKGKTLKQVLKKMEMVAEGVKTAKSIHSLSKKLKVDMPICDEVYKVLYQNKSPKKAMVDLMLREHKSE